MFVSGIPQWFAWSFAGVAGIAAVTDYFQGKIHNVLTLPALVLGLVFSLCLSRDVFMASFLGFAVATALFLPLFVFRILGAGDVKLAMALGTVLGVDGVLRFSLLSLVIGGIAAFALLVRHGRVKIFFKELGKSIRSLVMPGLVAQWPKLSKDIKAPFGMVLFVSFLIVGLS